MEIAEESLILSQSLMKNESLIANDSEVQNLDSESCDEHAELPSRHHDHPYCNAQTSERRSGQMEEEGEEEGGDGSVIHPSISRNTANVTFKSFTCPGGEVKIAEESHVRCESLMKNESLVQDESLFTKDSERGESFPLHVDDSVTRSAMSNASNPEGVVTTSDSYSALNGSTALERRDATLDTSVLTKGLNPDHQAESSPRCELSEHGGGDIAVSGKDDHIHCHVVKIGPELAVSEDEAQLSVQISNTGDLESSESVVRNEGSENMKSDIIVPESSSETTEEQHVNSVQQQTSTNPDENVPLDENARLGCDVQALSDESGQTSHSPPDADKMSENFGTAETQTVENHNTVSQNANDANVWTHADPEILRSESVDVEGQLKMWSHIIVSEPSTPKHSHLWLPESPIPPPQLHSTVLTAPLTPKTAHASDRELPKEKPMKDFSSVGKGPLEEQLRKMGELLIAASGKFSAPAAVTAVQQHSACVWTTPTPRQDHSTNTSAIMEERKELEVSDACTSTDSLLWR